MKNNVKHALSYALMLCMRYIVTFIIIPLLQYYFVVLKFVFHGPVLSYSMLNVSSALLTCNYMHAFLGM